MKKVFVSWLAGFGAKKENLPAYHQMGMKEAQEMMKTETDYILLDVRTEMEFEEGHIPGAINLPNEQIAMNQLSQLPDKSQRILVYCHSGVRSQYAAEKLAVSGYQNIIDLGGILDWPGELAID